ncbi:YybH family protein [Solimonas flava]|uniref:YybH family protein n=1 Tax=Solimonas flava TaxID=415849 RepID=UPI000421F447|nr:nuclear transport factor 2 family protein [Solimonas flava]
MHLSLRAGLAAALCVLSCAAAAGETRSPREDVADTERAFARTMADRDFAAFGSFVADEAIFVGSDCEPLRGKAAVLSGWKAYFAEAAAPFSWQPTQVEVLASGTLAMSRGPVHDPDGKRIGGFSSIWRREAPGVWKIVFDQSLALAHCTTP